MSLCKAGRDNLGGCLRREQLAEQAAPAANDLMQRRLLRRAGRGTRLQSPVQCRQGVDFVVVGPRWWADIVSEQRVSVRETTIRDCPRRLARQTSPERRQIERVRSAQGIEMLGEQRDAIKTLSSHSFAIEPNQSAPEFSAGNSYENIYEIFIRQCKMVQNWARPEKRNQKYVAFPSHIKHSKASQSRFND